MIENHARFRVRFYPHQGEWTVYVQRVDSEGVPLEDVLSADGHSKAEARSHALEQADDPCIREALEESVHE